MNFDWVDSVDSRSKKQPYQRFGTGHRFGGVPITTNCLYIGLMIPIIWAIYTQSHKKQYISLSEHLLCGTRGTRTAYVSGSHGSLPTQKASLVSTCGAGAARAGRSGTGGGGGGCKPICVNHSVGFFEPRKWAQHMLILGFYGLK